MKPLDDQSKNDVKTTKGHIAKCILLSKAEMDWDLLQTQLSEDWQIVVGQSDISKEKGTLSAEVEDMTVCIQLISAPMSDEEALGYAQKNFHWKTAHETVRAHKAHLVVSVHKQEKMILDAAVLLVKICVSCLKQPYATAPYAFDSIIDADAYIEKAQGSIRSSELPIMNLVSFGVYSEDDGATFNGYTSGLTELGKREIEVIGSKRPISDIYALLILTVSYVLREDINLENEKAILFGFSDEERLPITQSKGVTSAEDSFKIAF